MATDSRITIAATVDVPVEKAWDFWMLPEHITQWNNASDAWFTPHAENDVRVGGQFLFRMAARDGSFSFDFTGEYEVVELHQRLVYRLADDRLADITFEARDGATHITESFDPEAVNSVEMQQAGWQAILDNFKRYAERVAG